MAGRDSEATERTLASAGVARKRAPGGAVRTERFVMSASRPDGERQPDRDVARIVEDVVGCKWSLAVLARVREGVRRPGALEHSLPGLSTKVLNERLRKLVRYGILERTAYAEVPPRVEYALTPFGRRFARLLDDIEALQREVDSERPRR
jgi:DNA-binding HxlR family transcriptional regulator